MSKRIPMGQERKYKLTVTFVVDDEVGEVSLYRHLTEDELYEDLDGRGFTKEQTSRLLRDSRLDIGGDRYTLEVRG